MVGVDPDVVRVFHYALSISPIDFGIPEDAGLRTAKRQNMLYNTYRNGKRVSFCDGYEILSNHQANDHGYSEALDFYAYVDGAASWKKEHLAIVAAIILTAASHLGVPMEWGGMFGCKGGKFGWDMPHMQKVKN